jgi:hypothetical protein
MIVVSSDSPLRMVQTFHALTVGSVLSLGSVIRAVCSCDCLAWSDLSQRRLLEIEGSTTATYLSTGIRDVLLLAYSSMKSPGLGLLNEVLPIDGLFIGSFAGGGPLLMNSVALPTGAYSTPPL